MTYTTIAGGKDMYSHGDDHKGNSCTICNGAVMTSMEK